VGGKMISFTSIKIENLESYKKLLKYVPEYLIDEDVIDSLMKLD
jgi:hypothetical protein